VPSDPEPKIFVGKPDGKSAVFQGHADRPNLLAAPVSDFLELQGGEWRIGFQQCELIVCTGTNVSGKGAVIGFRNPRSRGESSRALEGQSVAGLVIGCGAGNAVVDAPGVEVRLKLHVDRAILIHPRVQLVQLTRRQLTNRAFDF
jgi:hypothetical protein